MELIVISETKVKVMLTADDMHSFSLDCRTAAQKTEQTRHALAEILAEVTRRTGLSMAPECLTVRMYPSRDGGCELFFSGISPFELVPEDTCRKEPQTHRTAYIFSGFDELTQACRSLIARSYDRDSAVYRTHDGRWVALLQERNETPFEYGIPELSYLDDYGRRMSGASLCAALEHGEMIVPENAVHRLSELCPDK